MLTRKRHFQTFIPPFKKQKINDHNSDITTDNHSDTTDESGDTTTDESSDTTTDESGDTTTDESGDTTTDESGDTTTDESGDIPGDESGDIPGDESGDIPGDESDEEELDSLNKNLSSLKINNPKAYENFLEVSNEISITEPNILSILTDKILIKDRTKLFHLYEIYKSTPVNTDDWLNTRNIIIEFHMEAKNNYLEYMKHDDEIHDLVKLEIDSIKGGAKTELKYKIFNLKASKATKKILFDRYKEFSLLKSNDDEYHKLKHWLTWATDIPHNNIKEFPYKDKKLTLFLKKVAHKLDNELFGMNKVKEQLLLFLNSKLLNPNMKKRNLG